MEAQENPERSGAIASKFFPKGDIKNIKLFYILSALNNAWFAEANWFFVWLRFMTASQLGLLDAAVFAYGLLIEIPSGAVADLIGKKKSIVAAMFLSGLGIMFMSFGQEYIHFAIGFIIAQTGWALYSGAAEAFAYDSLVEKNEENSYDRVISASSSINRIVTVITIFVGGFLYAWYFKAPHFAWGLAAFIGAIVACGLTEPKIDTIKFSFKNYLAQLKDGGKSLFNERLKFFIFIIVALLGGDFMFNWGIIKPAAGAMFGFMENTQALLFPAFIMISALTVKFIPQMRKKFTDKQGLFLLTSLMGFGYLISGLPLGHFGIIPLFIIIFAGSLAYPWLSIVVNREIDSKHRATALSTVALLAKLPYVILAIVAGKMIQKEQLPLFMIWVGLAILLSVALTFILKKIKTKKPS